MGFAHAHKANNTNYHLTPNPEKHNYRMFGKTLKTLIFSYFGPILPPSAKNRSFFNKWALPGFRFYSYPTSYN